MNLNEQKELKPVVGMPITYYIGSDRYSYTVIKVISEKNIVVRKDDTLQVGDYYGRQEHVVVPAQSNNVRYLSKRKWGSWREKGASCGNWYLGERENYQDPGF